MGGFTVFIWVSAAKKCLGEVLWGSWGKKTPSHLLKIYVFSLYSLLLWEIVWAGNQSPCFSGTENGEVCQATKARQGWWPQAWFPAAGFTAGDCRVPLEVRIVPQRAQWVTWQHWGCLWDSAGAATALPWKASEELVGLFCTGHYLLQHHTCYCADLSSKTVAGDGRKEVNESPGVCAQPFLHSFERFH